MEKRRYGMLLGVRKLGQCMGIHRVLEHLLGVVVYWLQVRLFILITFDDLGSRDRNILLRDIRSNEDSITKLVGHKQ